MRAMARLNVYYKVVTVMCILLLSISSTYAELSSCSTVKSEYIRQGFNDEVPEHPISGEHLRYCNSDSSSSRELTCCTTVMEHKLGVQSRQDFDTRLKKLLNPFANLLEKKHKKFDELFLNLLNSSQKNFDEIFTKTYGVIYLQNSFFFSDLFQSLKDYYMKGEKDMQSEMDNFFKKLYEKMFTVFNSQYVFNNDYLKCVNNHMEELKPFGDDPIKLTTNIKRSFVAFRTFVQGLATAASVVRNVPLKVNPSVSCVHELMKMSHCATCAGHQGTKPCLPYCLHVQELCLAHHLPLADLWTDFVDAMQNLGDRLEGPFNIGHEVQPIDMKISNAIMNFQEAGTDITQKVFTGCGKPSLGRQARSTRGELKLESLDFNSKKGGHDGGSSREHTESITKLVREIKTKIKNSQSFWSELPSEMCKEARHHGAANCWTGRGLGKYEGNALLNLSHSVHSPQMDEQVFRLKLITNKLREAYHGRDVSWIDEDWLGGAHVRKGEPQDDEGYDGSGSGWISPSTHTVNAHYPPDDEDGFQESRNEGSGGGFPHSRDDDDESREGSGVYPKIFSDYSPPKNNPYDPVPPPQPPRQRPPVPPIRENPSASPAEKPMTLTWAVAVYLLPAVFTFLGSIG